MKAVSGAGGGGVGRGGRSVGAGPAGVRAAARAGLAGTGAGRSGSAGGRRALRLGPLVGVASGPARRRSGEGYAGRGRGSRGAHRRGPARRMTVLRRGGQRFDGRPARREAAGGWGPVAKRRVEVAPVAGVRLAARGRRGACGRRDRGARSRGEGAPGAGRARRAWPAGLRPGRGARFGAGLAGPRCAGAPRDAGARWPASGSRRGVGVGRVAGGVIRGRSGRSGSVDCGPVPGAGWEGFPDGGLPRRWARAPRRSRAAGGARIAGGRVVAALPSAAPGVVRRRGLVQQQGAGRSGKRALGRLRRRSEAISTGAPSSARIRRTTLPTTPLARRECSQAPVAGRPERGSASST